MEGVSPGGGSERSPCIYCTEELVVENGCVQFTWERDLGERARVCRTSTAVHREICESSVLLSNVLVCSA